MKIGVYTKFLLCGTQKHRKSYGILTKFSSARVYFAVYFYMIWGDFGSHNGLTEYASCWTKVTKYLLRTGEKAPWHGTRKSHETMSCRNREVYLAGDS